jgi:hypothetical protein
MSEFTDLTTAVVHNNITYTIRLEWTGFSPLDNDDGFWPSNDPEDPGYVLPQHYEQACQQARQRYTAWSNDEWYFADVHIDATMTVKLDLYTDRQVIFTSVAIIGGVESDDIESICCLATVGLLPNAIEYTEQLINKMATLIRS